MALPEKNFRQFINALNSDADDDEVELVRISLNIDYEKMSRDQSVEHREARLKRARAKAIEKEITKKTALRMSDNEILAAKTTSDRFSPVHVKKTLKTFLFVAIIIFILALAYKFYSDHSFCQTRCCDGTCSSSEGQGTCSYHGGICNE